MSYSPLFNEKFRRPSISFTEMLKKGAGGAFREKDEYTPFMYRALVIAVDTEGGKLENTKGEPMGDKLHVQVQGPSGKLLATYDVSPTRGPINPKNSVRARIVSNNMDQVIDDDNLRTYWPLFPGAENPSPGELVYVVFEDDSMIHGLWLARVPMPLPDPNDPDAPKSNKNLMLMSDQLRDIQRGVKEVFNDSRSPTVTTSSGQVVKKPQRLTSLFVDTGSK